MIFDYVIKAAEAVRDLMTASRHWITQDEVNGMLVGVKSAYSVAQRTASGREPLSEETLARLEQEQIEELAAVLINQIEG